jgi:hypothetical protein
VTEQEQRAGAARFHCVRTRNEFALPDRLRELTATHTPDDIVLADVVDADQRTPVASRRAIVDAGWAR